MYTATFIETNPNFKRDMQKLLQTLDEAQTLEVACGYPVNKSHLATPYYDDNSSTIDVAIKNNFGYGVPERNFMDKAHEKIEQGFNEVNDAFAADMMAGKVKVRQALALMGQKGAAAIKEAIGSNIPPPNSPITIARKKSDRTLIDTAHMQQSATYAIRKAE